MSQTKPQSGNIQSHEPFKPLIRRARVKQLAIYEIEESELQILERGPTDSVFLNIAIAFLSIAVTLLVALLTTSTESQLVQTFFVVGVVVGFAGGSVLLLLWWRSRISVTTCARRIRERLPETWNEKDSVDDRRQAGQHQPNPQLPLTRPRAPLKMSAQNRNQFVEVLRVTMNSSQVDANLEAGLNPDDGRSVIDSLDDDREVLAPRKK